MWSNIKSKLYLNQLLVCYLCYVEAPHLNRWTTQLVFRCLNTLWSRHHTFNISLFQATKWKSYVCSKRMKNDLKKKLTSANMDATQKRTYNSNSSNNNNNNRSNSKPPSQHQKSSFLTHTPLTLNIIPQRQLSLSSCHQISRLHIQSCGRWK